MERGIGLPVAAALRRRYCRRSEERSTELTPHSAARLTVQPFRVVPHRDQQSDGRVQTDPHHIKQLRRMAFHEPGQTSVHIPDL
jgi:hypothetical protein